MARATIEDAWRVLCDREVLGEVAMQAERLARSVRESEAVCARVWHECAEGMPESETAYRRAHMEVTALLDEVTALSARVRHLVG